MKTRDIRSRSEETPVRTEGNDARINLFSNIFRQKLEAKFTKPALLKEGLETKEKERTLFCISFKIKFFLKRF